MAQKEEQPDDLQLRLREFIAYNHLTNKAFEEQAGLSNGMAGKLSFKSRRTTINQIAEFFPNLNLNWLYTGQGSMLVADEPMPSISDSFNNSANQVVSINSPGAVPPRTLNTAQSRRHKVPIVPQNIKTLPNLDVLDFLRRKCREVPYSSVSIEYVPLTMWYGVDDSAMSPLFRRDDLLALLEEKNNIVPGKMYVIDTLSQGLLFRILLDEEKSFLCKSLNEEAYPQFHVSKNDIIRIYKIMGMFRFNNNL